MNETKKEKLKVKDLVTIGIFNAIIIVLTMLIAGACSMVPPVVLFANSIVAFLVAPVYMLFVAKVNRRGVFILTGIIQGILYLIMGNPSMFVSLIVGGLVAELVAGRNNYKSRGAITVGYIAYMVCHTLGTYGPAVFFTQFYIDMYTKQGYSPEFYEAIVSRLTTPIAIAILVAVIVGAGAGSLIGRKLMKKHFEKAGIV